MTQEDIIESLEKSGKASNRNVAVSMWNFYKTHYIRESNRNTAKKSVSLKDIDTIREFITYMTESFTNFPSCMRRRDEALAALDRIAVEEE